MLDDARRSGCGYARPSIGLHAEARQREPERVAVTAPHLVPAQAAVTVAIEAEHVVQITERDVPASGELAARRPQREVTVARFVRLGLGGNEPDHERDAERG